MIGAGAMTGILSKFAGECGGDLIHYTSGRHQIAGPGGYVSWPTEMTKASWSKWPVRCSLWCRILWFWQESGGLAQSGWPWFFLGSSKRWHVRGVKLAGCRFDRWGVSVKSRSYRYELGLEVEIAAVFELDLFECPFVFKSQDTE